MKLIFILLSALFFFSPTWAQKKADSLFKVSVHQFQKFNSPKEEADFLILQSENLNVSGEEKLAWRQKALKLQRKITDTFAMAQNLKWIGQLEETSGNNELALTAYQEALVLFKKQNDYGNTIYVLLSLQDNYAQMSQFVNSANCFIEAKEIALAQNDKSKLCSILSHEGSFYFRRSAFVKAVELFQQSLDLALEINEISKIYRAHGRLGTLYEEAFQDYDKALYHYLESLKITKKGNDRGELALALLNVATVAIYQENYALALDYLNQSRIPSFETEYTVDYYYTRFGLYYERQKDYKNALENYKKGIDFVLQKNEAKYQRALSYADMGRVYMLLKEYTKAASTCKKGFDYAVALKDLNGQKVNCSCLSKAYKRLGKKAEAFDYLEKLGIIKDSLSIEETEKHWQNIAFTKQLQTDSIIQVQERNLLNATYEDGLRKKNREKNIFLIIGLMVLIFAAGMYSRLRFVRKSRAMLNIEKNRAEKSEQIKNTLFTNITHEFRTPLTVIKGMTDIIKSNLKTKKLDDVENSLEMIERNSDNLLHLVNEMLDLAKIESGNMELHLIQADVIPFLKYLGESFNSLAEENQISLTIYSEIDTLIMDFDGNKLTSVFSNLLSNAVKFTSEYGKIIVHINQVTQNENPYLLLKVKDNGIGIAKEELSNVFDRFYQTDTSAIRKNEGTGVGLALTKELVELMNGSIEVKSILEKGSEFKVLIPISKKAPTSIKEQIDKVIQTSFSSKYSKKDQLELEINSELPLVLIIEDNMDVAHYLKKCLANKYETTHAVNGIEGIEMAFEKIPDIIISDVMMPSKDGFEVCATLKTDERTDHIPIILLTAKVTIEDRLTGLSQGADAYLAKPFNKQELFTRLEQLLAVRKKLINKIQKEGSNVLLKKRTKNPKLQFLQKIVKLIHQDIGDSNFGSEDLAKKLLVSESQIYRKIKAITGKSTAVYIRSIRLQYAKELLINTNKTVSEVAYEVGFNDPSWFSRVFKDEFGFPPSTASSN